MLKYEVTDFWLWVIRDLYVKGTVRAKVIFLV